MLRILDGMKTYIGRDYGEPIRGVDDHMFNIKEFPDDPPEGADYGTNLDIT